jgi:hypothetical protein
VDIPTPPRRPRRDTAALLRPCLKANRRQPVDSDLPNLVAHIRPQATQGPNPAQQRSKRHTFSIVYWMIFETSANNLTPE